jgi:hypothetical protein
MNTARDFTNRLQDLLRRERLALADFIVALAEFDRQRLWIQLDYTSLFYFLHQELGLSKGAAFYRKAAAELVQRFPEVVEPLRDGRLCLTPAVELSKVLTPENRDEVLPRFFELSKAEAKQVAVEIRPDEAAPTRDVVTAVRARAAPARSLVPQTSPTDPGHAPVHPANQPCATEVRPFESPRTLPLAPAPAPIDSVEPVTAELSRIHITVSRRFLERLEAARDALSHSHPGAGMEEILGAGLDLLLERQAKRNGLVKKPLATPRPSSDPDCVPAHVRRSVWERDGGRCQWRMANGQICGSTHRLEIDHILPRAAGGPSTVENCRILCDAHNDLAARRFFGDGLMDRYTRNPRAGPPAPVLGPSGPTTAGEAR